MVRANFGILYNFIKFYNFIKNELYVYINREKYSRGYK